MPPLTRTMADIKDKRDAETDKILEEFYDGRLIRNSNDLSRSATRRKRPKE